jgi:hypothetical protein
LQAIGAHPGDDNLGVAARSAHDGHRGGFERLDGRGIGPRAIVELAEDVDPIEIPPGDGCAPVVAHGEALRAGADVERDHGSPARAGPATVHSLPGGHEKVNIAKAIGLEVQGQADVRRVAGDRLGGAPRAAVVGVAGVDGVRVREGDPRRVKRVATIDREPARGDILVPAPYLHAAVGDRGGGLDH